MIPYILVQQENCLLAVGQCVFKCLFIFCIQFSWTKRLVHVRNSSSEIEFSSFLETEGCVYSKVQLVPSRWNPWSLHIFSLLEKLPCQRASKVRCSIEFPLRFWFRKWYQGYVVAINKVHQNKFTWMNPTQKWELGSGLLATKSIGLWPLVPSGHCVSGQLAWMSEYNLNHHTEKQFDLSFRIDELPAAWQIIADLFTNMYSTVGGKLRSKSIICHLIQPWNVNVSGVSTHCCYMSSHVSDQVFKNWTMKQNHQIA